MRKEEFELLNPDDWDDDLDEFIFRRDVYCIDLRGMTAPEARVLLSVIVEKTLSQSMRNVANELLFEVEASELGAIEAYGNA